MMGHTNQRHQSNVANELKVLRDNDGNLSNRTNSYGKPHIYILDHCTANGITPTGNECLEGRGIMDDHLEEPQSLTAWTDLDQLARTIDNASALGRDWSGMLNGRNRFAWTVRKDVKKSHPRRYSITISQRE